MKNIYIKINLPNWNLIKWKKEKHGVERVYKYGIGYEEKYPYSAYHILQFTVDTCEIKYRKIVSYASLNDTYAY